MSPDDFLELYPEGAMPRIRAWQKAERDLWTIKTKLGLPKDASLIETMELLEGLIEIAANYEELCG